MSKTILLADDSLTIQKVVELTFADTDYEVVALSSGDELLQRIPEIRPDLVICDIIMPGRDGYEVCQEIKSDPSTLHIPVILLSGTFEPFDRDRALAAGCSEIITKPFEARKLVDTVERLLVGGTRESPTPIEGTVEPPPVEPVVPPSEMPAERALAPDEPALAAEPVELEPSAPTEYPSRQEEQQGLDFTDTGFAEMEAAGETDADTSAVGLPDDGLDFEFSDDFEAFEESASVDQIDSADTEPELEPAPPDVTPSPPVGSETEIAAEPVAEPSAEPDADVEEPQGPFPEPSLDDSRPRLGPDTHEPFIPDVETEPEPAYAEVSPPVPETSVTEDEPVEARTTSPAGFEVPPSEVSPEPEFEDIEESSYLVSDADADTAPVPSEPDVPPVGLDLAGQTPDRELPETPTIEPGPPVLSEHDVDRIARRILQLSAERIENIAWEVVPDMAEVVVRQRIRELEAEAESAAAESQPD